MLPTTQAFIHYIIYKRHCKRDAIEPVTYGAWLWLRGLSDQKPW